MASYTVIASNESTGVVAVEDDDGHCHLGRAVKSAPSAGIMLQGQSAALGLRALRIIHLNRPCPIDFLLLNCHPKAATRAIEVARELTALRPASE